MFGVYYNTFEKRDDYVVLYLGSDYEQQAVDSNEILSQAWFALDELPPDITPATQRRIDEYLGRRELSDRW